MRLFFFICFLVSIFIELSAQIPQSKIPKLLIESKAYQEVNQINNIPLNEDELIRIYTMPVFWRKTNEFKLQASEVSFTNWNGGGTNSISALVGIEIERNYEDKNFKWDNRLRFQLGGNKQNGKDLRKTEDNFEISSKAGFKFKRNSNWYYLGKLNFNTQFFKGLKFPNKEVISEFMAPGYLFTGLGVEHKITKQKFYMYLSPLTIKSTFVFNQDLANDGAFGVKAAEKDEEGNIIIEGENIRFENGILINNEYEREIFDNVNVKNRLSLYSDYINNFGNIDVDWEINFTFTINDYMKANFGSHLKYDDDVKIRIDQEDGSSIEGGSRIQWKQQFGIGLAVEL